MTINHVDEIIFVKFWFYPFDLLPRLFPGKNILNIAKINRIFSGKERWDKDFIFTYLDSSVTEVFRTTAYFFDIGHLQEVKMGQSWTKSPNSVFVCYCTTSGEDFGNIGPYRDVRVQKPPKNGYFLDAESVRKTLEIFNLTSTNAILIKLSVGYSMKTHPK